MQTQLPYESLTNLGLGAGLPNRQNLGQAKGRVADQVDGKNSHS